MLRSASRPRIVLLTAAALFPRGPVLGSDNPCFCNGLAIHARHPVSPYLSDPMGRRLGTDPKDGVFRNDMRMGAGIPSPPVTRIEYQEGTWLNKARAAIRLSAEDACAGVALIRIKAEGGREVGPGLIEMRKEGESRLEFGSVDNAGNEEMRREVKVRCDFTPPTVAHDYQGGRIAPGPVEIRFRAFDRVSGQAKVYVRVRHRDEYMHTGSLLRLSDPGTYTLRYNAVDPAGNWSEIQTLELELREQPWYRRWLSRVLGRARPGDG